MIVRTVGHSTRGLEEFTGLLSAFGVEAVWWRCHRALIADFLKASGVAVEHILSPGKSTPHPYTSAARVVSGRLTYAGDGE